MMKNKPFALFLNCIIFYFLLLTFEGYSKAHQTFHSENDDCDLSKWTEVLNQNWFNENSSGLLWTEYCDKRLQFELRSDEKGNTIIKIILNTGKVDYYTCKGELLIPCAESCCFSSTFDPELFNIILSSSIEDEAFDFKGPCTTPCDWTTWLDIFKQDWFIDKENGLLYNIYCDKKMLFELVSDEDETIWHIILDTGESDYYTCDGEFIASCKDNVCSSNEFDSANFVPISSGLEEDARFLRGPCAPTCTFSNWIEIFRQDWFNEQDSKAGLLWTKYCENTMHFELISGEDEIYISIYLLDLEITDYYTCDGELVATCNSTGCTPDTFDPAIYQDIISSSILDGALPFHGPPSFDCQPIVLNSCLVEEFQSPIVNRQQKPAFSSFDTLDYFHNELIVQCKKEASMQEILELKEKLRITKVEKISNLDIEVWHVSANSEKDMKAICEQYQFHEAISFIEPNYVCIATQSPIDTITYDPAFFQQWGLHNTGQHNGTSGADINALEGWEIKNTSPSVEVAIIDSGIDFTHPDLIDNIWYNRGEDLDGDGVLLFEDGCWFFDPDDINGEDDDGNGYIDDFVGWDFRNDDNNPFDGHGHGTRVAGVVGAKGFNGVGIHGVTNNVKLVPLKFLGDIGSNPPGALKDVIEAIQYAKMMGFPIINNSWTLRSPSESVKQLIESAENQLFIFGAANNQRNLDITPKYPSSYQLDNMISVAATDHKDSLYISSNYGVQTVDIAAPGVGIYSCSPYKQYDCRSGTSMAAPFVSGACALLWESSDNKDVKVIKEAILSSVDVLPQLEGLVRTSGRLNLAKALSASYLTCSNGDSLVLVEIFESLGGSNWVNSWDLSQPIQTWHGVGLNSLGCVEELNLTANGLTGVIPDAISRLSNLIHLNLSNNALSGSVPSFFSQLSSLQHLILNNTQLSGQLPILLTLLDNLEELILSDNNIRGCFPIEYTKFCGILVDFTNNEELEDFPEFCMNERSVCLDTIYPGDMNNDGIVNVLDLLYWGVAYNSVGPERANQNTQWQPYDGPKDWDLSINSNNPINAKYSDADGNGIVDFEDSNVIEKNYCKEHGNRNVEEGESNIVVRLSDPKLSLTGDLLVDIYLEDLTGQPLDIHGFAGVLQVSHEDLLSGASLDTENSCLGTNKHLFIKGKKEKTIEIGITRYDHQNTICDEPIGQFVIIADAISIDDDIKASVGGSLTNAIGDFEIIQGNDLHFTIPSEAEAVTTSLSSWLSTIPAICDKLGTIEIGITSGISPFTIELISGENSNKSSFDSTFYTITDLPEGLYQIKLRDAESNEKEYEFEIRNACNSGDMTTSQNYITPLDKQSHLTIIPNLVSSVATIHYEIFRAQEIEISIFDIQGRKIRKLVDSTLKLAGEHTEVVNLEDFDQGVYLVSLQTENQVTVTKVFIVK